MGKKLILATNNQGKVAELKALLSGIYDDVLSLRDEGITAHVTEDGETFMENARKKAVEISRMTDCDVAADDSGLCVDALGGAPGVYSARYTGENATDESNNARLIEEISKTDEDKRTARFVCAIALARGGQVVLEAQGECEGIMITTPAGENGFGYDPIFYVPQYGATFAQIPAEEKNKISHRARALRALAKKL